MTSVINTVLSVSWSMNRKLPPDLEVSATGRGGNPGWSNGMLQAKPTLAPPEDGIQEFTFLADGPGGGVVIQVIPLPISGHGSIQAANWMKGVRVVAATNKLEILFADGASVGDSSLGE